MTTIRGFSPFQNADWPLLQDLDPAMLAQLRGTNGATAQLPFEKFERLEGPSGLRAPFFDGGDSFGSRFASPWANDAGALGGVPSDPGRDLGSMNAVDALAQMTGLPREEIEQKLKDTFHDLAAKGMPLEARPGSKLAQAIANGDLSQLNVSELVQLMIEMLQQGRNPSNPDQIAQKPSSPLAPRGSWGPNGNRAGGGAERTGPNGDAPKPRGPEPAAGPIPPGTPMGEAIARSAQQVAGSRGTTGWCYKGVADAVSAATQGKVQLTGGSAYMAADQLASNPNFKEISVGRDQLKSLPPGAIVVWSPHSGNPHGHISVALGNGQEASDHIQQQITSLAPDSTYRVFMPKG